MFSRDSPTFLEELPRLLPSHLKCYCFQNSSFLFLDSLNIISILKSTIYMPMTSKSISPNPYIFFWASDFHLSNIDKILHALYVKPLCSLHNFPELQRTKARSWNPVDNLKLCTNSQVVLRNIRKINTCSKMNRKISQNFHFLDWNW